MGLFDGLTNGQGLFGLGGMGNNGMPPGAMGSIGGLLDPAALQKYKLKNLLLGAGINMLSQGPSSTPITFGSSLGQGLAGGLTAAQAAQQDYVQNAKMAYEMKRQQSQDQIARQQFDQNAQLFPGQLKQQEMTLNSATRDSANKAAFDQFTSTLPPEQQALAKNDPQGFAQMYMASKYPGRPQWGIVGTDMYGRSKYGYPPAYDPNATQGQAQTAQDATAQTGGGDMTGLTGNDYISNLEKNKGTGYANQVRAIVEGRAPYPTGMLIKTPYGQQLATDVTQADPTFETGNAQSRNTLRTNAKSGPLGKSTNAMNAAIVHLNEVVDNTMKLPNGNYPIINGIKKTYTDNTGGDSYTNFNTSMGKIASELTTAYRNGGGNEADILRELGNVNPSSSPTQILGSLLTSAHLLKGKIIANQKQVDEGMGPMGEHINMVPAEVDQTIARLTALHDKAVKGLPLTEDSTQTNSDPALAAALAKYQ